MLPQACDEQTAATWISHNLLRSCSGAVTSDGASDCSQPGGGGWPDAGRCSVLAAECGLLLRLESLRAGAAAPLVPQELVHEIWEQLLTAGQQVGVAWPAPVSSPCAAHR